MHMHSLRLALVAATLTAASLAAQAAPTQEAPAQTGRGQRGDRFKELNLSADQKTKMDALMQEERANRPARDGQQGPPSDADRKAMEARRADMDTKVKGILTPDQYTKYQAMRSQGGQGRGGQRPSGGE